MKMASVQAAADFADLFWPEFVEINGCVFLKRERVSKKVDTSYPVETESASSHTHIFDFVHHKAGLRREPFYDAKHPDFKKAYQIGRIMCLLWALKLKRDFPSDHFRVYLHGFDPIVRFHKIRKGVPNWIEAKDHQRSIESGKVMIVDTRAFEKAQPFSSANAAPARRR